MDLTDDDLAQDDLDELEQDEALLREIEELQLVNKCKFIEPEIEPNSSDFE